MTVFGDNLVTQMFLIRGNWNGRSHWMAPHLSLCSAFSERARAAGPGRARLFRKGHDSVVRPGHTYIHVHVHRYARVQGAFTAAPHFAAAAACRRGQLGNFKLNATVTHWQPPVSLCRLSPGRVPSTAVTIRAEPAAARTGAVRRRPGRPRAARRLAGGQRTPTRTARAA